jgi:plastocyanin
VIGFARMNGAIAGDVSQAALAPAHKGLGTVEGTISYRGDKQRAWRTARYYVQHARTGELAEAVVALSAPELKRKESSQKTPAVAKVDQKEMRFVPETVAIQTGDRVRFTNSDPQTHNISTSDPRQPFSFTIASGQEAVQAFSHASGIRRPYALGCSLHSQMQGWIYVFDHPCFQVTGVDGRFRIENVPPGQYRLEAAHSAGELHSSRVIDVRADSTLTVDIVLTPRDRSPQD